MSNIQKAFKAKAKRGLCMAAGGVLGTYDSGAPIKAAAMGGGNAADLIQNPTGIQDSPGGGELVVMGHDPMADLNSLTPNTQTSNRFYGGHLGNDPHFSASTSRVMQERNLGRGGSSGSGYVPAQRNAPAPNLMAPVDNMFQPRRGLQLADGGVVGLLRNRSAAIDGAVNAASQPAARPAAPAPVAAALPSQAGDYAAQAAALEAEQLAAARAAAAPKPKQGLMSRLGFAQGGVVRLQGPGTGTSDDIPLTLNTGGEGMNINVSNGEGLAVLPAKTMRSPEAVEAVNDIIETTNGKPPRGLKAGASYADGMFDKVRAGVSGAANWVADKVAPAAAEAPVAPAAPAGGAAPVAEAPATPLSAKTRAALRANMADQSLYGRTVEAVGNAKQSLERGAARVAASPYARELGRAATIVSAAGPAIENSLGENRIKPVGERTLGTDAAAGVLNSVDAGAKFIDNTASPITHGLNYAVKIFGGPENYFNDRALSNAVRRGIASTGEFTAPTTQNGEKVKIAGASSTPAAAIEPGAQERTFQPPRAGAPTGATSDEPNAKPANDIQVRSIRGANGKMQPEFYGKNVTQTYTGADGKPTTNWYETQAYKDSQVQAAKDKELLKTYEKWGLEGDLKSNNPAYQARGLARQKAFDENSRTEAAREVAAANRDLQRQELDIRREDLGLRRSQEQRAIAGAQFDREQKILEAQRKVTEDMDKDEEQAFKAYAPYFTRRGKDSQGNDVDLEDKDAHAAFVNAARHTVTQRGVKNPVNGKPMSFGSLNKAEQERLYNRWMAVQRLKSTMGNFPWNADKADSLNLDDFDAVQNNDGTLSFPKLEARMKGRSIRARQKDFEYTEPYSWIDPSQTPDNTSLQNLVSRSR